MNEKYTYVGAFLELTDIWEPQNKEEKGCPKHGALKEAFCPKCGTKSTDIFREVQGRKDIYGDKYEWTDEMHLAATDCNMKENFIILLPNHRNSGEIQKDSDGDEAVCRITTHMDDMCIQSLIVRYSRYMTWLKDTRKFKTSVSFGIVNYWN